MPNRPSRFPAVLPAKLRIPSETDWSRRSRFSRARKMELIVTDHLIGWRGSYGKRKTTLNDLSSSAAQFIRANQTGFGNRQSGCSPSSFHVAESGTQSTNTASVELPISIVYNKPCAGGSRLKAISCRGDRPRKSIPKGGGRCDHHGAGTQNVGAGINLVVGGVRAITMGEHDTAPGL